MVFGAAGTRPRPNFRTHRATPRLPLMKSLLNLALLLGLALATDSQASELRQKDGASPDAGPAQGLVPGRPGAPQTRRQGRATDAGARRAWDRRDVHREARRSEPRKTWRATMRSWSTPISTRSAAIRKRPCSTTFAAAVVLSRSIARLIASEIRPHTSRSSVRSSSGTEPASSIPTSSTRPTRS